MENLCGLLFELSNKDRLRILMQLEKEAMNVTKLSKELSLSIQESSRHVSRLAEVGLAKKDVNGCIYLTPYGELCLRQLQGQKFTAKHKDYFNSHSLERLPSEFVCRICELADSKYVNEATVVFYTIEKMVEEAEKYLYMITDEYPLNIYHLAAESVERGVKEKDIEPKDRVISDRSVDSRSIVVREEDREALVRARTTGLIEERILDSLDMWLFMSEKEVAVVGFPLLDGSFDYLGFTATNKRSQKWCKELFEYYWERARPRASVAQELHTWLKKRPKAILTFRNIAKGEEVVNEEEWISELERTSLIKQGKLTLLGELVAGKYCMYCGTPNPRGDAFCQTCKRRILEISF